MSDSISQLGAVAQPCRTPFQAPPVLQAALSEVASELTFGSGQQLFTANAPARGIYLVRSGAVRAYLASGDGREVVNRVLGPGALLGVPAAMCAKSYQFTGEAVTETRVGFVAISTFNEFLRTRPDLCMQVVAMMSDELVELRHTRDHMVNCTHTDCSLHACCTCCGSR
ncbi:MAG TPA: cyclic nucleotide-binding domain-containing protein [Clostridia bacterium]|nr:cyclic nucleotide-binding domain-containing protein [Clostridia bacterium]